MNVNLWNCCVLLVDYLNPYMFQITISPNSHQTCNSHNCNLSLCQKVHTYLLTTAGHSPAYSTFNSKLGSSLSTLWSRASKEITTASAVLSRSLARKCDNVVLVWVELLFGESLWIIVVVPDADRFWALGPNMGKTVNNQKWYFHQHMHNSPSLITLDNKFQKIFCICGEYVVNVFVSIC
jgi:hypothetical protein